MPRRCTICSHTLLGAIHRELRPGIPLREVALTFGLSPSALYRHVRGKHPETCSYTLPKPPGKPFECVVCRMGPEIREIVLQAHRPEKSVRHLAAVVGASRSAMRWHLRDCVPASFDLSRSDPSGPQTYRAQAVTDALARLDNRGR
jgi:hypothetical protein